MAPQPLDPQPLDNGARAATVRAMLLDFQALMELSPRIRSMAVDGEVSLENLGQLAQETEMPLSHAVASLALTPDLQLKREHETLVEVCIQGCQTAGSVATLQALLTERERRESEGLPGLDIKARPCLDACFHSPVLKSQGPLGMHLHPRVSAQHVPELAAALLDEQPDQ